MEIEAKFSVPDWTTFEELCMLSELLGYRLEPAGVKQIYDRYQDTDDRAIFNAGYACRVRREGQRKTFVATLKGIGGADAGSGIHKREEYEALVDDAEPTTWPKSSARDLVLQLSAGQPLRELFSINQERYKRLISQDTPDGTRQIAELSLDVVTIGGSRSHLYYELEIELSEQGQVSELNTLADHLRMNWGLQPEPCSKFERGLALLETGG